MTPKVDLRRLNLGDRVFMSNSELLKELYERFDGMKVDLGVKTGFEELDSIFFISDAILSAGFVSKAGFSRQVCSRIVDTYMGWNNYLHNLVMPVPNYMIQMQEHKMLVDDDKREIWKLIGEAMSLVSRNTLAGLTRDKKAEAQFIDDSFIFWNESFKPRLERIIRKTVDGWKK